MDSEQIVAFQAVHDTEGQLLIQRSLTILFGLHGTSHIRGVRQEYVLEASGVLVINPMTFYQISCPMNAGILCIHISPSILSLAGWSASTFLECYESNAVSGYAKYMELRRRIAILFRLYFQDNMSAELAEHSLALTSWMCRTFSAAAPEKGVCNTKMLEHMQDILRSVQLEWKESVSLSTLSEAHNLSAEYISRLFRKCLNITFTEYLTALRLGHAREDLLKSDKTITEISYENGFKNVSAFIEYFKKQFGKTPSLYRRQFVSEVNKQQNIDVNERSEWIDTLLQYDDQSSAGRHVSPAEVKRTVRVDVKSAGKALSHNWRRLFNIGYAQDGLLGIVQEQIRTAVREIGFTDIRFHGIFDDGMHIYHEQEDGSVWFNFTYSDILFDFILSLGLTPFVELGYIPSRLCTNKKSLFDRASFIGMYSDPVKWEALIQASITHWINRYGLNNVRKWHFSMFAINYPLMPPYPLTPEEYFEMYKVTWKAIKAIDSDLQFGGVGGFFESLYTPNGVRDFFSRMQKDGFPPDFLTLQCYPHESMLKDEDFLRFTSTQHAMPSILSKDENFTKHAIEAYRDMAREVGLSDRPLFVEEWNSTLWQRDLSSDTLYKACWLTKNILENYGETLGYWLLSDFIEEWELPSGIFHGGYGLFTVNRIPKSGYQAMRLLTCVGDRCLSQGNGWFVSRTDDEIQIFLYNYCHYDSLYRYRYQKLTDPKDAYRVFQNKGRLQIHLELSALTPGNYRISSKTLTRKNGSSFDRWLEIGAPDSMGSAECQYIMETSQPEFKLSDSISQGTLSLDEALAPHEVKLILIKKRHF